MTIPISSLSNQNNTNNLVNTVIQQTNQQSVIQSAGGSTINQTNQVKNIVRSFFEIQNTLFFFIKKFANLNQIFYITLYNGQKHTFLW